jgi:tetratricopeptide (TPR) repeat protein
MSPRRSLSGRGPEQASRRSGPEALEGEVDEDDFSLLKARYAQRLVEVEVVLGELGAARAAAGTAADICGVSPARPERTTPRRRLARRRVRLPIGIAAACCFVVAATLLASSVAGVRLPGESATGSVSVSSAQQETETLDRAAILGSEGQVAEAVQLYGQVLEVDPNQPDALAYGGWLIRLAGLSSHNELVVAKGDASVARAVRVAPSYPDAHALMGVIYFEDFARPKAAVAQFRDAAGAGAPKSLLASVAAVATKAFAAAGQALPPSYRAASKTAAGAG